jgi:hypothetical protein
LTETREGRLRTATATRGCCSRRCAFAGSPRERLPNLTALAPPDHDRPKRPQPPQEPGGTGSKTRPSAAADARRPGTPKENKTHRIQPTTVMTDGPLPEPPTVLRNLTKPRADQQSAGWSSAARSHRLHFRNKRWCTTSGRPRAYARTARKALRRSRPRRLRRAGG